MPGTTRYSATFDRPYEEGDPGPQSRRSRSMSWQANVGTRPYTPLGPLNRPAQRSSSTDSGGGANGAEQIPTRTTSKPVVKTHNNPFQFVKVGSCPLYRKAEEQLKTVKEVKKQPEALKEEEEEWQSNLDSWKSRRRKMSEDIFRRQEEIRQFETEEQSTQAVSKKTKTFSEMVESRAHRGRTMSLCLISSPLDLQQWELNNQNKASLFSEESEEHSAANSDDERTDEKTFQQKTNGSSNGNISQPTRNGSTKNKINKLLQLGDNCSPLKDGIYIDSGLESISSSHQTGDTPDSCSDFSQDSGSSIDCDSPRASGLLQNMVDDYNSKSLHHSDSGDSFSNMKTSSPDTSKKQVNGVANTNIAPNGSLLLEEVHKFSKNHCSNSEPFSRKEENSTESSLSELSTDDVLENSSKKNGKHEHSIESENEVFVDDFEELNANSCLSNKEKAAVPDGSNVKPLAKVVSVEISNKVEASADSKNPVEDVSLNVVFQSPTPKDEKPVDTKTRPSANGRGTLTDVLPVEQIAEEMEKLILQQLEEEERAKELSCKVSNAAFDIAPSKKVEPPKEKPPPPPNTEQDTQKPQSLKRINSTKRIKKEIYKRRSNFLGIENANENLMCDDSLLPPPNALEQIIKAEMELDRESMKRLECAAAERIKLEKKEIMKKEQEMIKKEQEIIANLETEEFYKNLASRKDSEDNAADTDRLFKLKEERKLTESEIALAETQVLRLEEEKHLKEREEYIKKQEEDNKPSAELSPPLLSDASNVLHVQSASLCTDTKPNVSLSETGEGNTVSLSASQALDSNVEKPAATVKPAVPPKPIKKKEAIRKERERLRQEQEALQKEREEHRLKLLKEQELVKSSQKSNAPVCRLGPAPPAKPSSKPKLTHNFQPPSARENVIFSSQSYHAAQNGISNRNGCVEPMPLAITKHKPVTSQKKNSHDNHAPHKLPAAKKTSSHESSPESSKYNQNHWLIQEAEMRRITELQERQHSAQFPHPAVLQDKLWSYARPGSASAKHPEKMLGMYPPHPPAKPSRVVPLDRPEQILSISGRKRCSHCTEELGRGAAMIIESLQLYYHIQCFQCCVCQAQLGNGTCGTDVRVRNNKLHCQNCYSNDEAGLKFSQV